MSDTAFWRVLLVAVLGVIAVLWVRAAGAQMCQQWGEMVVCDDGRTFHALDENVIVDDDNHTWVIRDGLVLTDQAYSTPIIGLFEEEGYERLFELEE